MTATAVLASPAASDHGLDSAPQRRFLPEVQALRAVAVLLVVAYHLRPDLVPGGFIGVDVFFVISGYLITGHMVREVTEHGRLRLAHFWANRARRILPAGLLVILLIVITASFVVPATEWRNLGRQAIASVFYVQNWVLAADSVDYSNSDNAATPFQHYWSLAVEEQFYLIWPLLVILAGWLATRSRRADLSRFLLLVFGIVVGASFAWSAISVGQQDASAYFVTTTRLWELGIGGILAVTLRYTERLRLLRTGLALAGLIMIGIATFAFSGATPFPGFAALVPTLGAVAVIAAGRTSGPGSLTWLVDRGGVQWIGNISYSLYLWHFPIAVYAIALLGRAPTIMESLGLMMIMFVGSAASYYWVEQPIWKAPWARRSDLRALIAAGLAMVLVAGCTSVFWIRSAGLEREWDEAAESARAQAAGTDRFGAASPREGKYRAFLGTERAMTPNPLTAKQEDQFLETVEGDCEPKRQDQVARRCDFGNPDSETVLAVVGDSHARMYTPAVLEIAEGHDWHVVTYIRNSCPYSYTARIFPGAETCLASNRYTAERLRKLQPDAVVAAHYAGSRFVDDGRKWPGTAGLASAWAELVDSGTRVVVIQDAPDPKNEVTACVTEHYRQPRPCANRRSQAIKGRGIYQAAARGVSGVSVVELTDRFCDESSCPAVIGNVLVYIDGNHISRTYSETLAPDLEPAVAKAVRSRD
jgi:peptidoglycan/LPS O-acetylase OafA/YrhL